MGIELEAAGLASSILILVRNEVIGRRGRRNPRKISSHALRIVSRFSESIINVL